MDLKDVMNQIVMNLEFKVIVSIYFTLHLFYLCVRHVGTFYLHVCIMCID